MPTTELMFNAPDLWASWTPTRRSLRLITDPLVERKVAPIAQRLKWPADLIELIQSHVCNMAVEKEFKDYINTNFFTKLSQFYALGHFPCGIESAWEGFDGKRFDRETGELEVKQIGEAMLMIY
jgi:hypothetical protein